MLKVMRKHAKYFYVFFVLIIISFVFWGVGVNDQNLTLPLAVVGKEKVSVEQYWRAYDNRADFYRDIYREKFDEKMQQELKENVLNMLLQELVLYHAAVEAGLAVSDQELQNAIMNDPTFIRDGAFNSDVYRRALELNRLSPARYEEVKRRDLTVQKMTRLVEEAIDLSPDELQAVDDSGQDLTQKTQALQALLDGKRRAALDSYVKGLMQKMSITVNRDLI